MKRFFLYFLILLTLINWLHTHAEAQAPTVNISIIGTSGTQTTAFDVNVTFNQVVTDFEVSDINFDSDSPNVSAAIGTPTGNVYPVTITPASSTSDGTLTISIPADSVVNAAAEGNAASNDFEVAVDFVAPTVTGIDAPALTDGTAAFNVTITFSEDVTGFLSSDLTLTNATAAGSWSSQTATIYTVAITSTITDGSADTVTIQVPVGAAQDGASRDNLISAEKSVNVDRERPTVTKIEAPDTDQNGNFPVTITFSEPVSGFEPSDLTVGGASAPSIWGPGSSDTQYIGTIDTSNISTGSTGDVTISVGSGVAKDAAENTSFASTESVDQEVTVDKIVPTVSISGVPSGEQNGAFDVTITFSEDVSGFATEDLAFTGPATATTVAAVSGSESQYTATIRPNAISEGNVTVAVTANAVTDKAGNNNTASAATSNIHIDTIVPTVAIAPPNTAQNAAFDVTFAFNEDVTGFTPSGVTVTNATKASDWESGATGSTYVLTLTPTTAVASEETVTIDVVANAAIDAASNANGAATQASVTVDKIVPTVSISGVPSGEQNGEFDVTITFSEDVSGFATGDLAVDGEATATAVAAVSGSKSQYTATIRPNAGEEDDDVTVTVTANTVTDKAGNGNTASATTSDIHIDTIVPTVAIENVPTTEQNSAYNLTIRFSEVVNDFSVADDLTVTLAPELDVISEDPIATVTLKSGVDGDAVYVVTVTPNAVGAEGNVTVTVNANTIRDFAMNANPVGSNAALAHIDTIVPTVAIEDVPTTEQNSAYDLTIRFSEEVNGFAVADDLTVALVAEPDVTSEDPIATVTLKSGVDGDAVYVVTVTPNAAGAEGNVTVTVNANTIQDFAMNANPAGSNAALAHIDTIAPTVAVSGFPEIEKNVAYDLTVTFSEPVKGFAVPVDLAITGPATAALKSGANGDAVYTVTITPDATSEGNVTVTVNVDAVQDFALNNNTASTETDVVHVDTIVPTVAIEDVPTTEQNSAYDLTIRFLEEVNGFAVADDLTVALVAEPDVTSEDPIATVTLKSGVDGDAVYVVTVTPNAAGAEGNVTVTVNANTIQDFAMNANPAGSNAALVHIDTIVPTVSMLVTPPVTIGQETGYPTEERNSPYTLTVTFSEPVKGFAVPVDLAITGPATAALASGADGDSVYTVTITPNVTSEGYVTVTVNANTIQDFATNPNPAGSSAVTVHIDTTPPTFTIEGVPVLQRRNDFFDIRIVFDEPVNDFEVPGDFTPSDLVTASLRTGADGASTYTVRITPNEKEKVQGELFIEVKAESVQDFALNRNANSVATQQPVRIDTIAPTVEITELPTGVEHEAFDVTITFAEVVNGFTTQDIALVGPATVALTAGTDGDAIYTAQVTPNPNARGNVTLQIPAAVVEDLAENANLASVLTPPIAIDTNALTVEFQNVPETVQLEAFFVMIVFSNDVDGFVLGDIEITGDAVILSSTLLGSGSAYRLTITPDENTDGDVIINVPADVAQDAAGKSNAASVPQTIAVAPKWIPDVSLRDAFREQLNLGAGEDYTPQQLRAVTTFESEMSSMSDLTGLEQATELTTLVLPGNEITDITPLQRLTELTTLNLAGNAITDISPLSGLTALTTLNLSGNGLTGIAALEDLTNLTTLNLSSNALTDISLLENFTQLTTLNLASNRITDISALTDLTSLTTLNLNDNPIGDFTPLTGLTALTTLELGGMGLSSLNAISGLTTLTLLNLNDNAIVNITPLSGLTGLRTLELADNAITTLTPLTALMLLTFLDVSENAITDVGPIVGLANLETLRLMGNPILNTAPLYPLTQRVRPVDIDIAVSEYPPWDVNEDGTVDALDLVLVTAALGQIGDVIVDPRTDVNADGTVDNADLTLVTANLDGGVGGAPATESLLSQLDAATLRTLDRATLETYLNQLRLENDGSQTYRNAIALLESLLAALRPTETRLLANYPNPFNPETWLPYELALDSDVEIFIYNARGVLVRHLELGHQPAGYYVAKSRAAYWDGRNNVGERVSSGIYFYQLRAGSISQLRKMVILK